MSENTYDDVPIYPFNADYARENSEIDLFRISNRTNEACRDAITAAVRENFDGMHLNPDAPKLVLEAFGPERTLMVLANTVMMREYDGRFSNGNKKWAKTVPLPDIGEDRKIQLMSPCHPTVLDGFIDLTRQLVKVEECKRPTLHERLQKVLSHAVRQPNDSLAKKDHER